MKITKFWVVLHPTKESELCDILFETTPQDIGKQFRGGLEPERIYGFYSGGKKAEKDAYTIAKWLLHYENK